MKKYLRVGLVARRQVRRFLLEEDIDFVEEKGWINSIFYLKCSDEKYQWVGKVLDEHERKMRENVK